MINFLLGYFFGVMSCIAVLEIALRFLIRKFQEFISEAVSAAENPGQQK